MTSSPRNRDRRNSEFIRWTAPSRREHHPENCPDPGFVVDRRRLAQYLSSLESLSGE